MKQESGNFDVQELTQKLEKIDELCKKDFFSNPVREIQQKMREELLDFSQTFQRNLRELDSYINLLESSSSGNTVNPAASEEEMVPKKNIEKKDYQIDILKRSFNEYEEKTKTQLEKLNTENTKLKYRIGVLLDTIEHLEKNN